MTPAPDLSALSLPELQALDRALRGAIAETVRQVRAPRSTPSEGGHDVNRKTSRINKPDLVAMLARQQGVAQKTAAEMVDGFLDLVRERAEAGVTVYLHRFGAFELKTKAARTARNPRTGEDVEVPETRRLVFRAAKGAA